MGYRVLKLFVESTISSKEGKHQTLVELASAHPGHMIRNQSPKQAQVTNEYYQNPLSTSLNPKILIKGQAYPGLSFFMFLNLILPS